ncbi:MAG: pyridoxamine 5'-phosphate oxidase family protein [Anaerolineaceae bacterium]|nr:pyridoxamine 5'-phosphate oxidase family protein [Anaerolineaceae bacterium]
MVGIPQNPDTCRVRPNMPGYGIAADPAGMLDWAWVVAQMTQARNYWVCSTQPDGRPHAAPVWGVWVDEALYFSTGRTSRKARNLAVHPNVVIHLESGDDTVIFEGQIKAVDDLSLLRRIVDIYGAKYPFKPNPEDPEGLWYTLQVGVVLAWREADFPKTATRWAFKP